MIREVAGALAQFVKQPRVFDGDDHLACKVLDQLDLFVGERAYLLPVDDDNADQPVVIEHRNRQKGPGADELGKRDANGSPAGLIRHNVFDLDGLFVRIPGQARYLGRGGEPDVAADTRSFGGRIVHGHDTKNISLAEIQVADLASQMRTAFASMVSKTGFNSPGEELMTRSTSEVAVCCSRASLRSSVRWRSSLSRRAFSMAITA